MQQRTPTRERRQRMRMRAGLCAVACVLAACAAPPGDPAAAPTGLVPLATLVPDAVWGPPHATGRPMAGSAQPACLLTEPAARALQSAQKELRAQGLSLKVLGCYGPEDALPGRGATAAAARHRPGSTVDLTLVVVRAQRASAAVRGPLAEGEEVDMGTPFGSLGAPAHTDHPTLAPDVQHNRRWLRALLQRHGFRNLPQAWWHYTLHGAL